MVHLGGGYFFRGHFVKGFFVKAFLMGGLFVVGLYLGETFCREDFLVYNLYVTFCIFKHALCVYKEDFLRHLVSL